MSVVFATFNDSFIALCADKSKKSSITGELKINDVTKIEKISNSIVIGRCGNLWMSDTILDAVKNALQSTDIENITIDEISDLLCEGYHIARKEITAITDEIVSIFIVAGKLPNGKTGVIRVFLGNNKTETEVYESSEIPKTVILEPPDLTNEECNELLKKAISKTSKQKKVYNDLLETAHRRAIRYVSEQSEYVGHKSDYIFISPNK